MSWMKVASVNAFERTDRQVVYCNDKEILVVRTPEKNWFAVDNLCSHAEFELTEGELTNESISCPLHQARFCLKTGRALCAPAQRAIQAYAVRLSEEQVELFMV